MPFLLLTVVKAVEVRYNSQWPGLILVILALQCDRYVT